VRGGVEWKEKLLLLILWIIKGEIEVIAKKSKWLKKKPANLKSRKYVVLEIKEVILYGELIQILKLNENKLKGEIESGLKILVINCLSNNWKVFWFK